jgi:DNA-3-methyladenine glycosylase
MFGPAGYAYVYFVFGRHWCLNVVVGSPGEAAAVLLRAGEVVGGAEIARARRGGGPDRDLARGPARLAAALAVDRAADGTSLVDGAGPIRLVPPRVAPGEILSGPRVGVAGGADTPWRFWLAGDPTVSPFRAHGPRVRVPPGR